MSFGKLDAWQLEFDIYHCVQEHYPLPPIAELMTLPLEYNRDVLKLMQDYAGKGMCLFK